MSTRRWKCTCAYDGTDWYGWQAQRAGQDSIQTVIEGALQDILKTRVAIHGSGRTDAGVHAVGQVFHFDHDWQHGAERLVKAVRTRLPESIQLISAEEVDAAFHARFSAVSKRYYYDIVAGADADPFATRYCWSIPQPLDINAIAAAARLLVGENDFAAFAANRGLEYESTVRTVSEADIAIEGARVRLSFRANGFLYKMVRSLAGTLVNVGLGRLSVDDVGQLVASAKRSPMVQTAPARGLFLQRVFYE